MEKIAAKISARKQIAEGTYQITFELGKDLFFKAGQYVWVYLPQLLYLDERGGKRAFSISSSPEYTKKIEIIFRQGTSGYKKTLIELLVVIAIIAILATLVFVALNPVKRFADARNARRFTDVDSILTATHEYIVDNGGTLPSGLNTTEKQLGTCLSGGATFCSTAAAACLDLSSQLAPYLKSIPLDPSGGTASTTGYSIVRDANNIVTVKSCLAEQSLTITVSR